jgi:hypothetical protein
MAFQPKFGIYFVFPPFTVTHTAHLTYIDLIALIISDEEQESLSLLLVVSSELLHHLFTRTQPLVFQPVVGHFIDAAIPANTDCN